jgi:CheY-like chemotaxis protein
MPNVTTWRLLVVDDDSDICVQIKEFLEGETSSRADTFSVETTTNFGDALEQLRSRQFDIVILDLRHGDWKDNPAEEAGLTTLKAIQENSFVPVIFHTGLAHLIQELKDVAIRVLTKEAGSLAVLLQTVNEVIDTRLPEINRALKRHVDEVQRDYMWNFVVQHWEQFRKTSDQTSLAYLLARRLAVSLSGEKIRNLVEDLGDTATSTAKGETVHPMEYYIMPSVHKSALAGDIYKHSSEGQEHYQVLLTPSCDLFQGKADLLLFARCVRLTDQAEYKAYLGQSTEANIKAKLIRLLKNNREKSQPDRYHYLPSVFTLPDLIVDFQQLETIPCDQLSSLTRVASLDSPFAEALMMRFTRYFGRLGTPDISTEAVLSKINIIASDDKHS